MTLADFLKVFDFEGGNSIKIYFADNFRFEYSATYDSKVSIEHDFCTRIYNVIDISPEDYFTIKIIIRH